VKKELVWCTPWIPLLLLGMGRGVVVSQIRAPFCDRHKDYWSKRDFYLLGTFFLFGFLGVIGYFVFRRSDFSRFVCLGWLIMLIIWVIIVIIVHYAGIRAKEITKTNVFIKGVSAAFVAAVEEADRQGRLRELEHSEDELLSQKRPATDAIEDVRRPRNKPSEDAFKE
jgi:hypothetical protein